MKDTKSYKIHGNLKNSESDGWLINMSSPNVPAGLLLQVEKNGQRKLFLHVNKRVCSRVWRLKHWPSWALFREAPAAVAVNPRQDFQKWEHCQWYIDDLLAFVARGSMGSCGF